MERNTLKWANIKHKALMSVDAFLTGPYQISAKSFEKLTENPNAADRLVLGRLGQAVGKLAEVFGTGLAMYGLSLPGDKGPFAAGLTLVLSAQAVSDHISNTNGSGVQQEVEIKLGEITPHLKAIRSSLVGNKLGISRQEIEGLTSIGRSVYSTELNPQRIDTAGYIGLSLASGLASIAYGDIALGATLVALGIAGPVLGKKFYYEADVVRAAKSRAAYVVKKWNLFSKLKNDHVRMTNTTNAISKIPEILIGLRYFFGGSENVLPAFYGIKQGLVGLKGVLTKQRSREDAKRTAAIVEHVIDKITQKPFIATKTRWNEHVVEQGIKTLDNPPFENGIVISDFIATLPSGEKTDLLPISLAVPAGGSAIIKAESGSGKSATMLSLLHLYEHDGSLFLVKDGRSTDVHEFGDKSEIQKRILLVKDELIEKSSTVTDLLSPYYLITHAEEYQRQFTDTKFSPDLVEIAWGMPDGLLEAEIEKIENGEEGIFPLNMRDMIVKIHDDRAQWVNDHLNAMGGNLAESKVHAERVFEDLSDGEKKRMMTAIAAAACKAKAADVIILDEPLANIDEKNKKLELQALRSLQDMNKEMALIIISHEHISELQETLNNAQVVKLEKNGNGSAH